MKGKDTQERTRETILRCKDHYLEESQDMRDTINRIVGWEAFKPSAWDKRPESKTYIASKDREGDIIG